MFAYDKNLSLHQFGRRTSATASGIALCDALDSYAAAQRRIWREHIFVFASAWIPVLLKSGLDAPWVLRHRFALVLQEAWLANKLNVEPLRTASGPTLLTADVMASGREDQSDDGFEGEWDGGKPTTLVPGDDDFDVDSGLEGDLDHN
jgi:hypothetical protein